LEVAFDELVKGQPVDIVPKPPESVITSFFKLRKDDAALANWVRDRKNLADSIVRQRVKEHATIMKPKAFAAIKDRRELFESLILPKFMEMLAVPDRKRRLLEGVFGLAFRRRHPDWAADIDRAFECYSLDTYDKFHVTYICIMTAMFYYYAPLCKIVAAEGEEPKKILGRSYKDQRSNLYDEKYVQSALLCERLLTRDKGMRNIMSLFTDERLWNGACVFFEPGTSVIAQLQNRF
jgi:hypothetical protein